MLFFVISQFLWSAIQIEQDLPNNVAFQDKKRIHKPTAFQIEKVYQGLIKILTFQKEEKLKKKYKVKVLTEDQEKEINAAVEEILPPPPLQSHTENYYIWLEKYLLPMFLRMNHPFPAPRGFPKSATWRIKKTEDIPELAGILTKCIRNELDSPTGSIPLVHGMSAMPTFLMELYEVCFDLVPPEKRNFSIVRMSPNSPENIQSFFRDNFKSVLQFYIHHIQVVSPADMTLHKYFDNYPEIAAQFISATPSLLIDFRAEAPLYFLSLGTNVTVNENVFRIILDNALTVLGIPEDQKEGYISELIDLQKEFGQWITRSIAQIFINEDIFNDVVYLSMRGGVPFNFEVMKEIIKESTDVGQLEDSVRFNQFGDTKKFLEYLAQFGYTDAVSNFLRDFPELENTIFAQELSGSQKTKFFWEHALQVRILGTSRLLRNPNNISVRITYDSQGEAKIEELRTRLRALVGRMLGAAVEQQAPVLEEQASIAESTITGPEEMYIEEPDRISRKFFRRRPYSREKDRYDQKGSIEKRRDQPYRRYIPKRIANI